jgi:microcystin-dependent protein
MSQPFIGEIRMVGFNFAPIGWAYCDGSILPISQYDAVYALLGTTYGGDGQSTFGLPDLRGRLPLHQGQSPGNSFRTIGEKAGSESVSLSTQQLPFHAHTLAAGTDGTRTAAPSLAFLGSGEADIYNRDASHAVALAAGSFSPSGNSQPHENQQPFLCVNFIIALEGIFPSRN